MLVRLGMRSAAQLGASKTQPSGEKSVLSVLIDDFGDGGLIGLR